MPDPLKLDLDGLKTLASEPIVRRGIDYFKEHRVTEIAWDARSIRATVEGSRPQLPYTVDIALDEDDELLVDCSCPFDAEPACKHAVAALLAYAARQPVAEVEVGKPPTRRCSRGCSVPRPRWWCGTSSATVGSAPGPRSPWRAATAGCLAGGWRSARSANGSTTAPARISPPTGSAPASISRPCCTGSAAKRPTSSSASRARDRRCPWSTPRGFLDLDDAHAITRAVALASVPRLPAALLLPIQEDARRLVGREVARA
jgi:hypothetical protein